MIVPTEWVLMLSAVLFAIGVVGVLVRRNIIVIFMAIELMLNAVNLTFVALARSRGAVDGQVVVFFVMTVAAAEAAVGLAIIIASFRNRTTVNADEGVLRAFVTIQRRVFERPADVRLGIGLCSVVVETVA